MKITDMTLSCLDAYDPSPDQLRGILEGLLTVGVDFIELSEAAYRKLRPLDPRGSYLLRVKNPEDAARHPEIARFVCRRRGLAPHPALRLEVQANDVREIASICQSGGQLPLRIVGLDDILCHDYESWFDRMLKLASGTEFCPENRYVLATGAAVEWLIHGGSVVTAFGGIDGKAASEEVLVAARIILRHKPGTSFSVFPELTKYLETILSRPFPEKKAVIGRGIFDVESGIHVDGILEKPQIYEPFFPELVGNRRKIIMGKLSGKRAVSAKLSELGFDPGEYNILHVLADLRQTSICKQSSLTDEEFSRLASAHKKRGGSSS